MNEDQQWAQDRGTEQPPLAAVVETTGSVILGLHPDHRIFAWNRAAELLYQTSRSDALGTDYVARFIAPEHQAAVAADIQAVLAGKRTLNFEDDSILPDGSRRTLLWNVNRVLNDAGLPSGIVATGQDITERKEAEERFRLVFEHAQDGLLLSDDSGVVDCNQAALDMLGLSDKSQLIGRRPAEFSPETQPTGELSDQKSRALGVATLRSGTNTFDWVHRRPDGTDVPVEVSVRHAMLAGRRVSVVAWRDQSRRIEFDRERAIVQQRLDLAQKMEAVGQLAGGIAHDFNNVLAAIRNALQLALYELPEHVGSRRDVAIALQTADCAAGLTRQLLAFSRQQPRETECIDLASLVRDVLPLLRSSLPSSISVQIDADVSDAFVTADRSQLEQVILNLVLNARDAMPDGGRMLVTVSVDHALKSSMLSVADSGTGMDESTIQRIFEPFYTTKPVGRGTGLGLSVVYGIVTQSGGRVHVDSAPGRGTTMRVALPQSSERPRVVAEPSPAIAPTSTGVLLVDDDDMVRSTTRRLLERNGWRVLDASNGDDAIALFRTRADEVSVVLSDVRMPVMDGVQLAALVRDVRPNFPIVFFSGYDELDQHDAVVLSTITLVQKPFSTPDLLRALQMAIAQRRPRVQLEPM